MGTLWKDQLPNALWAYRIAYKTPLGMSPYQLVYGKTCQLLVELEQKAHWAIKRWNMDFEAAGEKKMQLSELENGEKRHTTIQRSTKSEQRDGMTRGSRRRNLHQEIRYYFLILGSNYSGLEN